MKKLLLILCALCLPASGAYASDPATHGTESLVSVFLVAALYDPQPPMISQLSLNKVGNGCVPNFTASCPDGYMLPGGAASANFHGRKLATCQGMNPIIAEENASQFLNTQGVYCIKAS